MPSETSEDLVRAVLEVQADAAKRFLTPTARAEYETGDSNRFYEETFADQLDGLEEELLDVMNWASMSVIKLRHLRRLDASRSQGSP